ncbi:MAG: hypothetical protein ACRDWG_05045 [Actinomycetes bacterium]
MNDMPRPEDHVLLAARAALVRDLQASGSANATSVSIVEAAVAGRRWWLEQWPDGAPYLAGQVAQDVQDALLPAIGRWPLCPLHEDDAAPHELRISPDLGSDPHWFCEDHEIRLAPLGTLEGWVSPVR